MEHIFTGQEIIGQDKLDNKRQYDVVACAACHDPVSLRTAYIDPYVTGGDPELYVHHDCLSDRRKAEINGYMDSFVLKARPPVPPEVEKFIGSIESPPPQRKGKQSVLLMRLMDRVC